MMLARKHLAWAVPAIAGVLMLAVGVPSIVRAEALAITTTALPAGEQSVAYSQTLHASGGTTPYTWSITAGSLPAGLALDPSTGVINGTPTTTGTSNFTVRVTDSSTPTPATASQALSIAVATPVAITTATLPASQVGVSYLETLAATGGVPPETWSITTGSLPPGVTLDPTSGSISGTPSAAGTSNFTVQATDAAGGTASRALAITVTVPTLAITTATLPAGAVGTSYPQTLGATGGTTPYSWSIAAGSLPAGLVLGPSNGLISGTPTTTGTSSFTVRVTDSSTPTPASATKALAITVNQSAPQAPAFRSASGASFTVGQAGTFTISATGSPTPSVTESGGLPGGVMFTSNLDGTATLAGTPAAGAAGTYHLTLTASNGVAPNATQSFILTVLAAPVVSPSSALMTDLDGLAQAVQGVGPGRSLAAKVRVAQADVAAGNTLGACGVLNGFAHEVSAQAGKKSSWGEAAQLISAAGQIESLLSCPSGHGMAPEADEAGEAEGHHFSAGSVDLFEMAVGFRHGRAGRD